MGPEINHTHYHMTKRYVNAGKFPANLVTFTEKILNGKLHFCAKLFIFLTLVRLHKPEMLDEIELICKYGNIQKQPTRGVLRKKCSENMQQIYRRTPMAKCDLLK